MLAFIGSTELVVAAVVGLLLFGGRLPEVMRQIGKAWVTFRRALNELKRETGIDDALREIRRETDAASFRDWRRGMDREAGPARDSTPEDAEVEREPEGGKPAAERPRPADYEPELEADPRPKRDPDGPVPRGSHPPDQGGE